MSYLQSSSIKNFIDSVKNMDNLEIHKEVNRACKNIESLHGKATSEQFRYLNELKQFGFFMYCCLKPSGVSDENFKLYKEVAQNLVDKNQWKATALDVFNLPTSSSV